MSRLRLPTTVTRGHRISVLAGPNLSAAQVGYGSSQLRCEPLVRIPLTTSNVGLRSERGPLLLALMLSTGLVAIDSTIIATAVPSVVKDIGGFAQFPWLFSIYLLAQAVTTPIYGKLSDLFGRKPVMLLGIGFFLLGSIMCGLASSMVVLIVFRAVQGLGAGAVFPMAITIVGDIYTVEERARVQGYLASVWGISSVVGPTLGGVFSEYVSWRWIFFINIPLCLAAATMIQRRFHEKVTRSRPQIDYAGAVTLTAGLTLVILGVLEGGQAWAWGSVQGVLILVVGAVLLIAFVFIELHAADPVLPLWVLRRRLLLTSSLASCGIGAVVLGLSSYIPTYVQGVLGTGPVVAGFALATLTMGWPVAASQAGKVYLRIGFRLCSLIGASIVVVGAALLLLLGPSSTVVEVGAFCFVIGIGHGPVGDTVAHRGAEQCRLDRTRRGHRVEHVLPLDGQRGRRRGVRRDRQSLARDRDVERLDPQRLSLGARRGRGDRVRDRADAARSSVGQPASAGSASTRFSRARGRGQRGLGRPALDSASTASASSTTPAP